MSLEKKTNVPLNVTFTRLFDESKLPKVLRDKMISDYVDPKYGVPLFDFIDRFCHYETKGKKLHDGLRDVIAEYCLTPLNIIGADSHIHILKVNATLYYYLRYFGPTPRTRRRFNNNIIHTMYWAHINMSLNELKDNGVKELVLETIWQDCNRSRDMHGYKDKKQAFEFKVGIVECNDEKEFKEIKYQMNTLNKYSEIDAFGSLFLQYMDNIIIEPKIILANWRFHLPLMSDLVEYAVLRENTMRTTQHRRVLNQQEKKGQTKAIVKIASTNFAIKVDGLKQYEIKFETYKKYFIVTALPCCACRGDDREIQGVVQQITYNY